MRQDVATEIHADRADVLLCHSLDRLSRGDAAETLRALEPVYQAGGVVVCLQERWLHSFMQDSRGRATLVKTFELAGTFEALRRKESIQQGHARPRAAGKHVGRPRNPDSDKADSLPH